MQGERYTLKDLEIRLACLRTELYQCCGSMPLASMESLCRKIHLIGLKIYSFKGGNKNGKREQ
jgi:hypothetical protein